MCLANSVLHHGLLDNPTPDQQELLQKLAAREFRKPECLHTFIMFTVPAVHRDYQASVKIHEQWRKDFGFAYVSKEPKGIAVVGVST